MANRELASPELLRKLLDYDLETGALTWRERTPEMFAGAKEHFAGRRTADQECRRWNSLCAGQPAFTSRTTGGYLSGCVWGRKILAHRAAWAIHYGAWPSLQIDHIDGDPQNNRIANLREATIAENGRNRSLPPSNKSGRVGVSWVAREKKWRGYIKVDGRNIHLGTFADKEQAIRARDAAEKQYGFHANHGRRRAMIAAAPPHDDGGE